MNLKKKLLILGGSSVNCKFIKAAKALGVYTIVTDNNENAPGKRIADESLNISVFNVDSIIDYCKANHVDGVANFSNTYSQLTQQKVCEILGLPSYGTYEQYIALTDKTAFKKLCTENGVDVIPEYREDCLDEVEYPVLVKPADSSGSRGISVCRTKTELVHAVAKAKAESNNGKIIIEKFMEGKQDFSVEYYCINGNPYLVRASDRYVGLAEEGLNRKAVALVAPTKLIDFYVDSINPKVTAMIRALGVQNAPIFLQGFVDGNTVRFYDPGFRFAGLEYGKVLLKATGLDLMTISVLQTLGEDISQYAEQFEKAYELNGKTLISFSVSAKSGTISVFDGIDTIRQIPGVVEVSQLANVGDFIPPRGDVAQKIVEIDVLTKRNEMQSIIDRVQEALTVLDEYGNNILATQFELIPTEDYE